MLVIIIIMIKYIACIQLMFYSAVYTVNMEKPFWGPKEVIPVMIVCLLWPIKCSTVGFQRFFRL